jgi:hypothetical protein
MPIVQQASSPILLDLPFSPQHHLDLAIPQANESDRQEQSQQRTVPR